MAATNGFSRMPPLGTSELDQVNIALIAEWISEALPGRQTFAAWQSSWFGSTNGADAVATGDPDNDGRSNREEFLSGTNPLSAGSILRPLVNVDEGVVNLSFNLPANRSAQIDTSTDLTNWKLWDVPGNSALPSPAGGFSLSGSPTNAQQFFRVRIWEN
jgi:hypothetical protein